MRALPVGLPAPRWAWGPQKTPWTGGYRAIVAVYDHTGQIVSLRARWCRLDQPAPNGAKAVGPLGTGAIKKDMPSLGVCSLPKV